MDAAVATTFALAVVEPAVGEPRRRIHPLVRLANGQSTLFDFQQVVLGSTCFYSKRPRGLSNCRGHGVAGNLGLARVAAVA